VAAAGDRQREGAARDWPAFPRGPRAQRLHSMVMTRHFILVHVPRTGGQFIRKVTFEQLPPGWFIRNALDAHTPWDVVADDFAELPMFAVIRNPWDWYVSWYHYLTQTDADKRTGPMWMSAFEKGASDFSSTVTRACSGEGFDNPTTGPIMRELDCDHLTASYMRIAGRGVDAGRVELGRFESMQRDFLGFLRRHQVPVDDAFVEALMAEPPYGSSKRGPYQQYYDDELRDLVGRKARRLVELGGYEF
jgi:hypothetical protein